MITGIFMSTDWKCWYCGNINFTGNKCKGINCPNGRSYS